jgi:hypothetical protein
MRNCPHKQPAPAYAGEFSFLEYEMNTNEDDVLLSNTPMLTQKMVNTIHNLANAMDLKVNAAMDYVFGVLPYLTHPVNVCFDCGNTNQCKECYFNYPRVPHEILNAFAKLRDTSRLLKAEENDTL